MRCLSWLLNLCCIGANDAGDVSGSPSKKKRRKQGVPEGPQKKYKQMQFTGTTSMCLAAHHNQPQVDGKDRTIIAPLLLLLCMTK